GARRPLRRARRRERGARAARVPLPRRVRRQELRGRVAESRHGGGTPLMQQYRELKSRHQVAILFFRHGDISEMILEDADPGARVLSITLTSRGDGVPLAGVPVKAAAEYLRQLVAAGHRVAICEQVEDPKLAKGIVRREVVETVTPGALLQDGWVAGGRNNWLVALSSEGAAIGLAAVDLSTGEFALETLDSADRTSVV